MKNFDFVSSFSSVFGESNSPAATSYLDFIVEFLQTPIEKNQNLLMFFRAAMYSVMFLSTGEPSLLHYQASREVLQEVGGDELESQPQALDLLVRELVKECQIFGLQLLPKSLIPTVEKQALTLDGRLELDKLFSSHISLIGPHGRKIGEALLSASNTWYQNYVKDGDALALFRLWVDFDIPPYYCRYLKLLAEILWKDRAEIQFQKFKKHLPALTLTVQRPLSKILSSRAEISMNQERASVVYEGKIIAETSLIESQYGALLAKGIQSFGSIYHHKLLRYECQTGYENWIEGKAEPRVIRFERGETEIAEILGFKFKQAPGIIKSLLYAQARMMFHFDDANQGHLIALRKFKSRNTSREEGLEITLSTQLMPYYTFQTDRRGRLLVPMPALPPFVSAPQYHAGQALLQMFIMEEFTNRSMELTSEMSIEIPEEKWSDWLKQSGLPRSVFKQTRYRWLVDGDDGPRFLVQIDKNRYVLGDSYVKELNFFYFQGTIRKERQQQGRISVRKKQISRLSKSKI
jgi:hypothetical protein